MIILARRAFALSREIYFTVFYVGDFLLEPVLNLDRTANVFDDAVAQDDFDLHLLD
jgi:hypothetical protein